MGEPADTDADRQALDDLRACILAVDSQMAGLMAQRREFVNAYDQHRAAIIARMGGQLPPAVRATTVPVPAVPAVTAPPRQEWSGARVRALLLWLGAALLGVSAVTFTAVAWSHLDELGRALLLLAATGLSAALAVAARRRLPMTAEAFVGLTVVLALIDVFALRRARLGAGLSLEVWWALGTAVVTAGAWALGRITGRRTAMFAVAALLPVPPLLLIFAIDGPVWAMSILFAVLAAAVAYGVAHYGSRFYREGRGALAVHAFGSWILAALIAVTDAASAITVPEALQAALAVGFLAAAPEIVWRTSSDRSRAVVAATVVHAVPAGVLLTALAPLLDDDGAIAVSVGLGLLTILAASVLPVPRSTPALIAGTAVALPGTLWTLAATMHAVVNPLSLLGNPWTGTVHSAARTAITSTDSTSPLPSWSTIAVLAALAVIAGVIGVAFGAKFPVRRRALAGFSAAAAALLAASAPLVAGSSVLVALIATTTTAVALLIAGAFADGRNLGWGPALLPGAALAAVPALGWAAVSTGASVVTSAIAAAAATAAAFLARLAFLRPALAGLAAALAVTFVGVAVRAAGVSLAGAGFAVVVAAAAVTLIGVFALGDQPAIRTALECAGLATAFAGLLLARDATSWVAGSLTALAVAAGVAALRPYHRFAYSRAALALALLAVWTWLLAADIRTVEAYTAPAAAVALAAGTAQWRSAPGQSWRALSPALVLAIGPTLTLGIGDNDTVRQIVAAVLCLAAVLAGAVLRLQAPLILGAIGLIVLGIDQWGDNLVRLPRWITLGTIGVVLMWIGATFEHRRRDLRRASDVLGHFG